MNPNQASVKLSFDKVKDGVSIKLRVSQGTKRVRYRLPEKEGVVVSEKTYERLITYLAQSKNQRAAEVIRELYHNKIEKYVLKAQSIIDSLIPFSFERFEQLYFQEGHVADKTDANNVVAALLAIYNQMEADGRIGNADVFRATAGSLERFIRNLSDADRAKLLPDSGKKESVLRFEHITPAFLDSYERWMLQFGRSPRKEGNPPQPASMTTVGIYLRHLRAGYNGAIKAKIVTEDQYPFGRKDYVIPAGSNVKKALKKEVIRQIIGYACEPASFEERSRDLWLLSYLSNGMNLTDICNLKWSDINTSDQTITFVRNKTSRSRRGNQTKIVAMLFAESKAIIERWANPDRSAGAFVFKFLVDNTGPRHRKATITQVIKVTNKYMKRIGQAIGVEVEIKTYSARHSFASTVLKSGADLVYIKEKMGHGSLKSTELYTKSILDEDEHTTLRESLL